MNLTFVVILIAIIYLSEKKVDTKVLVGLGVGGVVLIACTSRTEGVAGTCAGTGTVAVGTPATCTGTGGAVDASCTIKGTFTEAECEAKKTKGGKKGNKACVFKAASKAADATCTRAAGAACTPPTKGACLTSETGCVFKAATVAYAAKKPCADNNTETACKCKWSAVTHHPVSPDCDFYQDPSPGAAGAKATCENDWTIIIGSLVLVVALVGGISYAALSKDKK
jgi:hypothetical protein